MAQDVVPSSSDLRPTFVTKPDMRYGTTFLSYKYRDFAVRGETIQDKETGEIFTKRPSDGRVVSFFQNKKYLTDLMLDLRILLNNNLDYIYPNEVNYGGFYLSTDYDLTSINNEKFIDITALEDYKYKINTSSSKMYNHLEFNLTRYTNGFVCRLQTRDVDRNGCEWLTTEYNKLCKGYTGDNEDVLAEAAKFPTNGYWEDSNAVITYNLTCSVHGTEQTFESVKGYVRINEDSFVKFPFNTNVYNALTGTKIHVEIESIEFPKFKFVFNHTDLIVNYNENYNKFIHEDHIIELYYCNIQSFVYKSTDIVLLGNEFIVAAMDLPFTRRYLDKVSRLQESGSVIAGPGAPERTAWKSNAIWAEEIHTVEKDGKVNSYESNITDIDWLEIYLAKNKSLEFTDLTEDGTINEDFYIGKETAATKEEVDSVLNALKLKVQSILADNIIVVDDGDPVKVTNTDDALVVNVFSVEG